MASEKWSISEGFSNMGEDNESVVARLYENNLWIGYQAYGGVKVVELDGIVDTCKLEETGKTLQDVADEVGDDYEVALPVIVDGKNVIIVLDNNDYITIVAEEKGVKTPNVVSSDVYEWDDVEEFYEEHPEFSEVLDLLDLG